MDHMANLTLLVVFSDTLHYRCIFVTFDSILTVFSSHNFDKKSIAGKQLGNEDSSVNLQTFKARREVETNQSLGAHIPIGHILCYHLRPNTENNVGVIIMFYYKTIIFLNSCNFLFWFYMVSSKRRTLTHETFNCIRKNQLDSFNGF